MNRLETLKQMLTKHGRSSKCLVWPYSTFRTKLKSIEFTWYGQVMFKGEKRGCHCVAYILCKGPIPRGKRVLHKCDNPPCFNPRHLFLGSQADNMHDMRRKGRCSSPTIPRGELNARAVLTQKQADEIRKLYKPYEYGFGCASLAKQFGVSKQTVQRIVRHQTYE